MFQPCFENLRLMILAFILSFSLSKLHQPATTRSFPNPILTVWGTTLAFDALRVMASAGFSGVRLAATAAAAAVAETSPAVLVGGAAGAAAIAGAGHFYRFVLRLMMVDLMIFEFPKNHNLGILKNDQL